MSTKSLGLFQTGRALNLLFDRANSELSKDELEFMARASDHAEEQADAMGKVIGNLALMTTHENFEGMISDLLFQTSVIFEGISGLIHLAANAQCLLDNPTAFNPAQTGGE